VRTWAVYGEYTPHMPIKGTKVEMHNLCIKWSEAVRKADFTALVDASTAGTNALNAPLSIENEAVKKGPTFRHFLYSVQL
jgi:hypothetical protein